MSYIIIFTTCASKKEAIAIAAGLLKKRLVGCANILDSVDSRFWWKGRIDRAKEVLVTMKARRADFSEIERTIKRLHSYEVPEIIALPIVAGSKDYLAWINESVSPKANPPTAEKLKAKNEN